MPNFGAVGTALAKETNWEPEEEPETEDEREYAGSRTRLTDRARSRAA